MQNTPESIINRRDWSTIRQAYLHTDDSRDITASGYPGDINLSDIFTRIIQLTGRFAESYASDVLSELNDIQALVSDPPKIEPGKSIDVIIPMGIRRQGVDHDVFLMHRLLQTRQPTLLGAYIHPEHVYRAILACRVLIKQESGLRPYITCTLRSVMDSVVKIMPDDMDGEKLAEH